jgi:predicted protein tyrosine phosphatase
MENLQPRTPLPWRGPVSDLLAGRPTEEKHEAQTRAMNRRLRVLFVCAMNKQRSVTAEQLYRNDARLEVRSGGVRSDAKRRVNEDDLRWADVVFVMEREHKVWLATRFEGVELPPIEVLDIPDDYECMDPQLQEMLRLMLDPEIDALLAAGGDDKATA